MSTKAAVLCLLVLSLTGCASTSDAPPVTVFGAEEALVQLAGSWHGEYWSAATGRSGIIRFQLQANSHEAWGAVWMSPGDRFVDQDEPEPGRPRGATELPIRFVRALDGGELTGTLDPYRDPQCDCMLSTSFVGRLSGDVIEGTFTTQGPVGHAVTDGRWRAEREK